jgi:hypothetical protein
MKKASNISIGLAGRIKKVIRKKLAYQRNSWVKTCPEIPSPFNQLIKILNNPRPRLEQPPPKHQAEFRETRSNNKYHKRQHQHQHLQVLEALEILGRGDFANNNTRTQQPPV